MELAVVVFDESAMWECVVILLSELVVEDGESATVITSSSRPS